MIREAHSEPIPVSGPVASFIMLDDVPMLALQYDDGKNSILHPQTFFVVDKSNLPHLTKLKYEEQGFKFSGCRRIQPRRCQMLILSSCVFYGQLSVHLLTRCFLAVCSAAEKRFDASQYAFFGRDVTNGIEIGGLDEEDYTEQEEGFEGDGEELGSGKGRRVSESKAFLLGMVLCDTINVYHTSF